MSNMPPSRISGIVIALAAAAVFCPRTSSADVIFSQTGTPSGHFTETSTEFWAQSFTVGSTAEVLSTVDVSLTAGSPSGEFFVDLYSNNAGSPGTMLEALTGTNNPPGGISTYSSSGSALSANTTYWIVQGISSGGGFQYWDEENNNSPEVGSSIGAKFSFDSGSSWSLQPGFSMQMVVNGTEAVPEPSTVWAAIATTGGVFLLRRRRGA